MLAIFVGRKHRRDAGPQQQPGAPWFLREQSVPVAQRCQFALQQGLIAEVEFHQTA